MLKNILSNLKEYKITAILSPFFVIIEVFMDIAIPYLMSIIVDKGVIMKNSDAIMKIGILLLISIAIAFASGLLSGHFATKASSGLAKNLRSSMFKNIQNFSFKNVDDFSKSSLITRMTTDIQNIQTAFQMSIRLAIRSPLMLIFAFIMSFKINSNLAFKFLIVFPIILFGMYFIVSRAYPIFSDIFKGFDKLNNIVSENLNGIRVVKSFVKEDHEIKKFENISDYLYKKNLKVSYLMILAEPIMQFSIYLVTILIAWSGTHLIVNSSLETGQLMSMITYAMQIQISLMLFSMTLVQLTMSRNSAERINEVLIAKSDIVNPEHGIKIVNDGSIEFKNVNFSYFNDMNKLSLKNINFKINSGDNVGIIGSTASSKSTLINLIPRLYDVTSGEVLVSGKNVRDYDIFALRDSVSVVLQKNNLFSGTVLENLRWGKKDATEDEAVNALKIAQASFIFTNDNGLNQKVEREGTNFSGGQKQRLCIARAILKNPKILILDDSTSALDNKTENDLTKNIKEYFPDMTRITISQRVNSIMNCDYIIVMDNGEISDIGTHEYLMENNTLYNEIYNSQIEGGDFDAK